MVYTTADSSCDPTLTGTYRTGRALELERDGERDRPATLPPESSGSASKDGATYARSNLPSVCHCSRQRANSRSHGRSSRSSSSICLYLVPEWATDR